MALREKEQEEDSCPNCGQLTEGDSVCPNCGAILGEVDDELEGFDDDDDEDDDFKDDLQ